MGGSTLIKVCAVYFGPYLENKNQLTPPHPKPSIVSRKIISQCRRSMARISRGVIPSAAPRAAIAGLGVIILGSTATGFCPASAICQSILIISKRIFILALLLFFVIALVFSEPLDCGIYPFLVRFLHVVSAGIQRLPISHTCLCQFTELLMGLCQVLIRLCGRR